MPTLFVNFAACRVSSSCLQCTVVCSCGLRLRGRQLAEFVQLWQQRYSSLIGWQNAHTLLGKCPHCLQTLRSAGLAVCDICSLFEVHHCLSIWVAECPYAAGQMAILFANFAACGVSSLRHLRFVCCAPFSQLQFTLAW